MKQPDSLDVVTQVHAARHRLLVARADLETADLSC